MTGMDARVGRWMRIGAERVSANTRVSRPIINPGGGQEGLDGTTW